MNTYALMFLDGTHATIEAEDIHEAEAIAATKYRKGVEEAWQINDKAGNLRGKYTVLFNDGTSSFVWAIDKDEAYAVALDQFTKAIVDIWRD